MHGVFELWMQLAGGAAILSILLVAATRLPPMAVAASMLAVVFLSAVWLALPAGAAALVIGLYAVALAAVPTVIAALVGSKLRRK
ncbi:hypothetical protein K9B35_13770 [Sphingomonas sp. R647]|uniref:hypothetical protein n=1 Tax=Sphingomonas sp. R647 TaxID=2875233 RepID=UPI001CD38111|nr:hypothetical protein [Sphingomonas sp. R647]MCA1199041.1 hypothetical protein [Sphingomonas sp. R647]